MMTTEQKGMAYNAAGFCERSGHLSMAAAIWQALTDHEEMRVELAVLQERRQLSEEAEMPNESGGYTYWVTYTWAKAETGHGSGCIPITRSAPVRTAADVNSMGDLIVKKLEFDTVAVMSWTLLDGGLG